MSVRDTFPHTARWDSVGLDCSYCRHFSGPPSWPDVAGASRCGLHQLPLAIELGPDGYKQGEWFCRDFVQGDSKKASATAVRHLHLVRDDLAAEVLYGFSGTDGQLKEHSFGDLRKG